MGDPGGMATGPDPIPVPPPADTPCRSAQCPSLWKRVVVVLAGFVGLTTLSLFFGVDHFVSARFARLHAARVAQLVSDIQQTVDGQLAQMAGTASLLVNDLDLVNSTYYHLYLEGGKEQPRAAIDRIAKAFHIESVTLWDMQGGLVAAAGSGPEALVLPGGEAGVRTAAIRLGDEVWLVAVATLTHNEDTLAQIQLAQPLTGLLGGAQGFGVGAVVRVASRGPPPPGVIRVPLDRTGDSTVELDVAAPDEVNLAVTDVKKVLALVMTVFGLLLVVGIAVFLRRLFRPVIDLISAALAVGRGEFGQVVAHRGPGEVARLVDAFNQMAEGLRRLRALEREVQHRDQLSAIGRVAARVAHDLNNPLTVISNVARLVAARKDIDGELAADMQLVVHHCERSITTIEALLAYGRPIRLRRQEVDLAPLCEGVARRWASRFPDVTVTVAPPPPAPLTALADPYRVEQVLDNLLDNARAFGRHIEVALGAEEDMAFVRVADDGPGFSPEAREHAFEPFFTTRTGGTGLGLASCLAIARGHGGDLDIESGPPATVTLWLPLAEELAP
jgi:signal transduction histidine kinase